MSVRMRHTSSHTKNRRSHHALKDRAIVKDKESGALRLPHRLDETTGMYRGKQIAPAKKTPSTKPIAAKADAKAASEPTKEVPEEKVAQENPVENTEEAKS